MRNLVFLSLFIGVLFLNHKTFAEEKPTAQSLAATLMSPKQRKAVDEARLLIDKQKYDDAIARLKAVNDPPQSEVLRLLAHALLKKKDYLEAIRALEIAVATNPRDFRAYSDLGGIYLESGRLDKANENIRKAIDINSLYRPAYDELLALFEKKKSNYEMRIVIADMISKFGEKAEFLHQLCRLYALDNYSENAITACQRAISADPKMADSHVYLGLTYKHSETPKQGETIIFKTADHFPKSEFAQFTAGQSSDETKNFERSTKYYLRGLSADKNSQRCRLGLARAYYSLKNYAESLKYYSASCKADRTVLKEFQKTASLIRMANDNEWYEKFNLATEKCGFE